MTIKVRLVQCVLPLVWCMVTPDRQTACTTSMHAVNKGVKQGLWKTLHSSTRAILTPEWFWGGWRIATALPRASKHVQ
ncbi:hypothetical protein CEXT_370191 [Caerostris extrusa]|uniref:Secreted protein n=1 Tax=Caerostris extrusa TaxID=172846 RepID=A0AAV4NDD3_CAEEX|nr:hypothetical protein CEXT_370191 [Caerostris extrusa]